MVEAQYPRCEQVETWDHVIKCRETISLRKEFVKDLVVTLVKNKPEDVNVEATMSFVEDALKHIENEEEEEHETNQQHVGTQELFRGRVAIDWEGANLNTRKCKTLNKIIARKCVEFHMKCWKKRNNDYHDENKQRKRILKWHEKIKMKAENSNETQMRLYVKKHEIKVQQCKTETIKRWINNVKEFDRKIEKNAS